MLCTGCGNMGKIGLQPYASLLFQQSQSHLFSKMVFDAKAALGTNRCFGNRGFLVFFGRGEGRRQNKSQRFKSSFTPVMAPCACPCLYPHDCYFKEKHTYPQATSLISFPICLLDDHMATTFSPYIASPPACQVSEPKHIYLEVSPITSIGHTSKQVCISW